MNLAIENNKQKELESLLNKLRHMLNGENSFDAFFTAEDISRFNRRNKNAPAYKAITIEKNSHAIITGGQKIRFKKYPFKILVALLLNMESIVTREFLLTVIDKNRHNQEGFNVLKVHIYRIRKLLYNTNLFIKTHHNKGYEICYNNNVN